MTHMPCLDRDKVLDMGFAPERVDWALYVTKNAGLQPALDHLEANQENPVPTDYKSAAAPAGSSSGGAGHDVSRCSAERNGEKHWVQY